MKKIYFIFTILIIVLFSYDFSFADDEKLTLPISPQTFIDVGAPADTYLSVFNGPSVFPIFYKDTNYLPFGSNFTFYCFSDGSYFKDKDYSSFYTFSKYQDSVLAPDSIFVTNPVYINSHDIPSFIDGKNAKDFSGGVSMRGRITPSVYYFDGENVFLRYGEDVGFPDEFFHKGDETIRIEVPKNQSVVFSVNQIVSLTLSNLKFKWQFFTIGQNWEKRLKDSNYDVRFFINGNLVTDYESSIVYSKVPSANVLEMSFRQNFKDGEKYVLKAELFKNGESVAWHKIDVICQTSFVDKNGDGFDDNTGVKIPNGKGNIDSLSGFFDFIFGFFSSLFEALKRLTFSLREFVVASSNFAKVLVSIFSANPVISSIFSLSLTIAVFLRIMKR